MRSEIIYLLNRCMEKYRQETGLELVANTNKKNYEPLASLLSEISNLLPETAETLQHNPYTPDVKKEHTEYPFRKYDITGGQIRDAFMGLVGNPRPFLLDACYIYLYGVGRQGFDNHPTDPELMDKRKTESTPGTDALSVFRENEQLKLRVQALEASPAPTRTGHRRYLLYALLLLPALTLAFLYWKQSDTLQRYRQQMSLLPYQPSPSESDSLEGVWVCYTGSPQARKSDPERYHKIVANLMQFTRQRDGYYLVERYGASFNHSGYAQFESKGIVSIHTHVKNKDDSIESPRHSLLSFAHAADQPYLNVISASWNFDAGPLNQIIGIREVYQKLGQGGKLEEIYNSLENAQCKCKIIRWHKPDGSKQSWYLKNNNLDSLHNAYLSNLLNEKSILLKDPDSSTLPIALPHLQQ
ncbi:MAG: hypothetical protein ACK5BO_08270 [Bacteroidota bacterium]